jgi:carbamoyltransferase
MFVLGVSMSSHDRSAALLRDGRLVAAVAEERLDRRKKSQGFYADGGPAVLPPLRAITSVLRTSGIGLSDVDLVVCGRSITTCRDELLDQLPVDADRVVEPPLPGHHLAHAYSAYLTAPFGECDVLVIDEQGSHQPDGEFETCTWFSGAEGPLRVERRFPGGRDRLSLGMYFDAVAALTGLSEAGLPAAGKLMALAGLGRPHPDWPAVVELTPDGGVGIDLARLERLFVVAGLPMDERYADRPAERLEDLRQKFAPVHWGVALAADLARFAQDELEAAVLHTAGTLHSRTGRANLAYAGGVALNCTANARLREAGYTDVFVHPAATDDGAAVGLAGYGWIEVLGRRREPAPAFSPRLGPAYQVAAGPEALREYGLNDHAEAAGVDAVATEIATGRLVCFVTGRSEWGPRALGGRSILADPTDVRVITRLNAEVKFREPFRPFGVSVASAAAPDLLDLAMVPSSLGPYMLAVAHVRDPRLSGVTHADGTVRYQIVTADDQPYHDLLLELRSAIGLPAVLNTSFNTHGEPLVETFRDAVRQFLLCGADALWLDGLLLRRAAVPDQLLAEALGRAAGRSGAADPLRLALHQEAAGYPQAARRTINTLPRELTGTPDRQREHAGLLMRLALFENDTAAAVRCADEVLRWSGLPGAAVAAAEVIASHGPSPALPNTDAAQLLAAVGSHGAAARTLRAVFSGPVA